MFCDLLRNGAYRQPIRSSIRVNLQYLYVIKAFLTPFKYVLTSDAKFFHTDIDKPSNRVVTEIIRKKMKNGKIKKIFKIIKLKTTSIDEETPVVPGRRRVRCGDCDGCSVKTDCGKCTFCR